MLITRSESDLVVFMMMRGKTEYPHETGWFRLRLKWSRRIGIRLFSRAEAMSVAIQPVPLTGR